MLRSGVWAAVAAVGLAGPAVAQTTYTWTNPAGGNWGVGTNWDQGLPPNSINAIARFNLPNTYSVPVTDGAPTPNTLYDVRAIQFTAGQTGNVSLATASNTQGGPRITLNPGAGANGSIAGNNGNTTIFVDAASGNHTINVGVRLGGTNANHVWEVQTGRTLTLGGSSQLSTSGPNSGNTLTKVGGGTLALNGSADVASFAFNAGLFVNGGTVQANGTLSPTGTGPVTVNSGGTFGGRGLIQVGTGNSVTVNSGGTLTAGTSAAQTTLTINQQGSTNGLVMAGGATYRATLFGTGATQNSTVAVNGAAVVNAASLLTFDVAAVNSDPVGFRAGGARTYTVMTATDDTNTNINFQAVNFSVVNGSNFVPGEFSFGGVNLDANSGITSVLVNFNPVPEPGAALAVAAVGMLLSRRRVRGLVG